MDNKSDNIITVGTARRHQSNDSLLTNVAVHFGNFYGMNDIKRPCAVISSVRKIEFTRQMVHKLEKLTAGTADYSREIATLLNVTVEPPNFRAHSPPADNCAPNDGQRASYPLWYKEPDKMPDNERSFKDNNDGMSAVPKSTFDRLTYLENNSDTEDEDDVNNCQNKLRNHLNVCESSSEDDIDE